MVKRAIKACPPKPRFVVRGSETAIGPGPGAHDSGSGEINTRQTKADWRMLRPLPKKQKWFATTTKKTNTRTMEMWMSYDDKHNDDDDDGLMMMMMMMMVIGMVQMTR